MVKRILNAFLLRIWVSNTFWDRFGWFLFVFERFWNPKTIRNRPKPSKTRSTPLNVEKDSSGICSTLRKGVRKRPERAQTRLIVENDSSGTKASRTCSTPLNVEKGKVTKS